jgi:DNA-binding transcriptional ArsR family regulator
MDNLNQVLSALADPTRRAIVERLASGEATVSQLAEPFSLSQPAISKHLKVLEAAGLVKPGRSGQRRPRRLQPEAIRELSEWAEGFRVLWERRFDNLDRHLAAANEEGN